LSRNLSKTIFIFFIVLTPDRPKTIIFKKQTFFLPLKKVRKESSEEQREREREREVTDTNGSCLSV
jgi:hypothetical protein